MKCLKRESERRDKRWAPSVDLTHSIHPLFLHHALLVHAFTPPPLLFLHLPLSLSSLSVWPAKCGCHGERAKVSASRGGSAMKPLSKPRLGIVFMFSPSVPQNWASSCSEPQYCRWKGVERLRHGGSAAVCCSAAPRPASWGVVQRRAQLKELRHKAKPFVYSSAQFLCSFIPYISIHSVHVFGMLRLCFGFASVYAPVLSYQLLYWMLMDLARGLEHLLYIYFFLSAYGLQTFTQSICFVSCAKNEWEI